MNREAVRLTLAEGRVCYWSRSRRALWRKGETSGQVQRLREMRLDCDGDTVLLLVDQTGVACHTGRRKLLLPRLGGGDAAGWTTIAEPEIPPEQLYPARDRARIRDRPDRPASPALDSAAPGSWGRSAQRALYSSTRSL